MPKSKKLHSWTKKCSTVTLILKPLVLISDKPHALMNYCMSYAILVFSSVYSLLSLHTLQILQTEHAWKDGDCGTHVLVTDEE